MSRKSRKVPILAQDYVRETMPLTIKIARALTEAYNRDKQLDPLDDIAAAACKILAHAGLPSSGDVAFELPKLVAAKGFNERTPEWYAAEVLERVRALRVAAPNFQGFERDWRLIRLGRLLRSAEIEISMPGALDHGSSLEPARRGLADRNARAQRETQVREAEWLAVVEDLLAKNPSAGPGRCVDAIIARLRPTRVIEDKVTGNIRHEPYNRDYIRQRLASLRRKVKGH